MDPLRVRRGIRLSAIVIILSISNFLRINQVDHIRVVLALTLITLGMGIGALIVNLRIFYRMKNSNEGK